MTEQTKPYGWVLNMRLLKQAGFDPRLTNRTFRILGLIVGHAGQDGKCFFSISKMSKKLGVNRYAVQRPIQNLVKLGYLKVIHNFGGLNDYELVREKTVTAFTCNTIALPPMQQNSVIPPATLLGGTKKPDKETTKREQFASNGLAYRKRSFHDQNKEKLHEKITGITRGDEEQLAAMKEQALSGMSQKERMSVIVAIEDKVRNANETKKKQHMLMFDSYAELALNNVTTPK